MLDNAAIVDYTQYSGKRMKSQQQFFAAFPQLGDGVRLWQIAEALGIADCSLSRKLRKELPEDEKQKIFGIIKTLSKEVGE